MPGRSMRGDINGREVSKRVASSKCVTTENQNREITSIGGALPGGLARFALLRNVGDRASGESRPTKRPKGLRAARGQRSGGKSCAGGEKKLSSARHCCCIDAGI